MSCRNTIPRRIELLGVPIDGIGLDGVLRCVRDWLDAPDGGLRHVVTVNPEYVVAAWRDPRFGRVLNRTSLAIADGVGIIVASRILGNPSVSRVTGVQFVNGLAGLDHPNNRIFLLGAAPDVAEEAASTLRKRYQDVRIVGVFPGDSSPRGYPEIDRRLADVRPTVLLVAFGHPRQDIWIWVNRERLANHGILVAAGVGGVYDYLSGRVPLAPEWIRKLGLEWLFRLIRQPWRWRRQLALPVFVVLVLREWVRQWSAGCICRQK